MKRMEKLDDHKIRLTFDYYIKKKPLSKLLFDLRIKDKVKSVITQSLQNLDGLLQQIRVPESSVRI